MNELVHQNYAAAGSYEAEVEVVRNYLRERLLWMDNKLGYSYTDNGIAAAKVDFTQSYQVYNMAGQPCSTNIQCLPAGVYIVSQGQRATIIFIH